MATDAELDVMIVARLESLGIDITQLPAGSTPDPVTGSPGRDTAMASLRAFIRGTVADLAAFSFPPAAGGAPVIGLTQQTAVPALYPAVDEGRTR